MPPPLLVDPATLDVNTIVADLEGIRRVNPQRFELEQLTAIILVDGPGNIIAGYKDVRPDEFWVRGHMPDYALLPGVLICEAAAQLCSYYVTSAKIFQADFLGFGGMENVRFRGMVRPGDRLLLVARGKRLDRRQVICNVQGFVDNTMVFHGDIIGMPMVRSEGSPAGGGG
jgi:3-hydroxyacyl-[acyl-carrier-protein] dehydratase